jgi:hypothetical protein
MITLVEAAGKIQDFEGGSLTNRISSLEANLRNTDKAKCASVFHTVQIDSSLLDSALRLKQAAGQVNVLVRNNKLWGDFKARYGERFSVVSEYYEYCKSLVHLIDITEIVPQFRSIEEVDQDASNNGNTDV